MRGRGSGSACPANGLEHGVERALDHRLHVVRLHKAHLDVALGELRLPVGAAVLVSEAPGELVVLVKARQHQ